MADTLTKQEPGKTHGIGAVVPVMLLTAGALLVIGRVIPLAGDAVALVLGIELLVSAVIRREEGAVVAGGLLTGVGAGVVLASGPLQGASSNTVGGVFALSIGVGFGLVALVSAAGLRKVQPWAWITAGSLALFGVGLLAGVETLAGLLSWVLPTGLLVAGAALTVAWWRKRQ